MEIEASLTGITASAAGGQTLTAPRVDNANTFEEPEAVAPKPIASKVQGGMVSLTLAARLVSVISVEP